MKNLFSIFSAKSSPPSDIILDLPLELFERAVAPIPGGDSGRRHTDCARRWEDVARDYRTLQRREDSLLGEDFAAVGTKIRDVSSAIYRSTDGIVQIRDSELSYLYTRALGLKSYGDTVGQFAAEFTAAVADHRAQEKPALPAHTRGRALTPLVAHHG